MPVVCVGAPGRTESLSDSEDVSFDEDFVGTCRSKSELSVVVVRKVVLKGGCKTSETAGIWVLKSIPMIKYAW